MTTKTDIEQLRAEFEVWKSKDNNWCYVEIDADAFEIFKAGYQAGQAALQSQDAEDAERYRWLRAQDNEDFEFAVVKNPHFDVFQTPQELDEAIDHARRIEGEAK